MAELQQTTTIYPPIIDNTISAFVASWTSEMTSDNKGLEVIFYHQSKEGVRTDYVLAQLKVGGTSILKDQSPIIFECRPLHETVGLSASNEQTKTTKYHFYISNEQLEIGYFKINTQMIVSIASIREDANVQSLSDEDRSQWSDGAIKYALPPVKFEVWAGMDDSGLNRITDINRYNDYKLTNNQSFKSHDDQHYHVVGQLSFEDDKYQSIEENIYETDEIIWYQIQMLDTTSIFSPKVLETSEAREFIDRITWDQTGRSFKFSFQNPSFSSLNSVRSMKLAILFATRKGYLAAYTYSFSKSSEEHPIDEKITFLSENLSVTPKPNHASFLLRGQLQNTGAEIITGMLIYQRAKKATGTLNWATFYEQTFQIGAAEIENGTKTADFEFEDVTAEGGVAYCYKVLFRYKKENENGVLKVFYANNEAVNESANILFYDEIFLATRDLTMKITYNPSVTNFKRNIQTIITPTLGGQFPFIRRGGAQNYRTFSLGGLISFNNEAYIQQEEIEYIQDSWLSKDSPSNNIFEGSLFINESDIDLNWFTGLESYERNQAIERLFRDKVMDFLYADHIILYKSVTEGNMFIRLTDVSFTPDQKLDRNIWSFSATATEVLETNNLNYMAYFGELEAKGSYILTDVFSLFAHVGEDGQLSAEGFEGAEAALYNDSVLYVSKVEEQPTSVTIKQSKVTEDKIEYYESPLIGEGDKYTENIYVLSDIKLSENDIITSDGKFLHLKEVQKSNLVQEYKSGSLETEDIENKEEYYVPNLYQGKIKFI